MDWFDGHLDLAYLALEQRDMARPLAEAKQGPQPAAVTFPSLREGRVGWALGTIFPVPKMYASYGYDKGDIEAAHEQGKRQLAQYHAWEQAGLIEIVRSADQLHPPASPGGSGASEAGAEFDGEASEEAGSERGDRPLQVIILMEGAAPIRTPDELLWWYQQGVRVIGLSWAIGSQYAGGNYSKGPLTEAGRALIAYMDELKMIHDLSHLSDEAAWSLLEYIRPDAPAVASHSNCRALLDGKDQRHLSDALIQAIGERGGIIGLNLLSRFLIQDGKKRRARVEEALRHVAHICDLLGHGRAVALGSDMDGGFAADQLPEMIDAPADLRRLVENDLWTADGRVAEDFAHGNWLRFLGGSMFGAMA